jgi:hypothetical protein
MAPLETLRERDKRSRLGLADLFCVDGDPLHPGRHLDDRDQDER